MSIPRKYPNLGSFDPFEQWEVLTESGGTGPAAGSKLLAENGDFLITEAGDFLITE